MNPDHTRDQLMRHPLVQRVRLAAQQRSQDVILVGGAVRDALMGQAVLALRDFDFAVAGDAVALARAVANAHGGDFYLLDPERGTARVLVTWQGQTTTLDFALRRGVTWQDDLRARDFSVNAIAIALASGEWLDALGGIADLQRGTLRLASASALEDDPVRALRAVRLAHQIGLRMDDALRAAVQRANAQLHLPSAERLRDELFAILDLSHATAALQDADALGLLPALLPEINLMRAHPQPPPHRFDVLEHTWHVLSHLDSLLDAVERDTSPAWLPRASALRDMLHQALPDQRNQRALLRFGTLLHDCAKPVLASERGQAFAFNGHEQRSAQIAAQRARALRLSNAEITWCETFVAHHARPNQMAKGAMPISLRTLYRLFREVGDAMPMLALFAVADCWGKRGDQTSEADCAPSRATASRIIETYYARFAPDVLPMPLLSGYDILQMGVPPGPQIGATLEAVREAQLCGDIRTRAEALEWARRYLQAGD